ncbi:histidinol dehydrogenase [Devriesea agamarum]|uniref:histidinol dehydrogenase n=1 Tax=Devriesea agamarum TaxID=472569 RepID=UPI00071CD57A|nr:histidinol dehydrogenase [Devriesea agamarum]
MTYLRRHDVRGRQLTVRELLTLVPRPAVDVHSVTPAVREIVQDVAARGAVAVSDWSQRLDGVRPPSLRVPQEAIAEAERNLDPAVRQALMTAIERVKAVDSQQRRQDDVVEVIPGGVVRQRWVPVRRVGLYVPGGRAVLPSSVVMNAVPALVAGVKQLALASPPQKEHGGLPHPTVLAACALLGIDEVYAAGGAQAIALFAYGSTGRTAGFADPDAPINGTDPAGAADAMDTTAPVNAAGPVNATAPVDAADSLYATDQVDPVDLVTGPGNVYVAAAKRLVNGTVGIDAEAGPTEIAILADDSADPTAVAADLISQAEHDVLAGSVLVTDSDELLTAVEKQLAIQVPQARHHSRIDEALRGPQSGVVMVDDIDQGLAVVDAYGAEHLEIMTRNAAEVASRVTNAGAIFVGPYAPVSLGDYAAGSNHVLPTGGTSRHSGGLGVQTFLRGIHVVEYSKEALAASREAVLTLSTAEDLPAHGRAVTIRLEDESSPSKG